MAPSVKNLSEYLVHRILRDPVDLITWDETEDDHDQKIEDTPWSPRTCSVVLYYVVKLLDLHHHGDDVLSNTISRLEHFASEYQYIRREWRHDIHSLRNELRVRKIKIAELFVKSFMSEVRVFFKLPKLSDGDDHDKSVLKENEILAGFMDFLLQILDSESLNSSDDEQRYATLRKELRYVLTFLGDVPFQCSTTELEQVNKNILAEFEIVANEVGAFIYYCFFEANRVKTSRFDGGIDSLLELVRHLNDRIKEHCIHFSELIPRCIINPKANIAIDSLFIVDSLLEDLENVISGRFDLLRIDDIKDHMETIREEMKFAQTFLKDIEVVQDVSYADKLIIEFSTQIVEVAYEAEYLVNSYVVGSFPNWYMNLRLPTVIQKIKLIFARLEEIKKLIFDMKVLKVEKVFNRKLESSAIEAPVDDDVVVGFEDEKSNILDTLTTGSNGRQTISIFGMPGLGKTTLAKKLYNDPVCCEYFDERAWCVVSQTYQRRNVLIGILMSLAASKSQKPGNFLEMEDQSLGLEIHKSLKGKRYLIVIDDVWDSNTWDDLRRNFPDDSKGSRIILTSRMEDAAPIGSIFYPLGLLSEVQCWDLLKKKVFIEEPCPPQLLGVGKGIAAKCHGLPLATCVIAGILSKLEKEESVWERVERNLDSHMFDDQGGCLKILELSYQYLPNHLKLCFLYLGGFPEDAEIQTRKLMWLWMAEGCIPKQKEKSPEDVAEDCLVDLTNRCLVMVVKRRSTGGIKTCSIHDLLHEMCLRKAHEENFLKSIKEEFSIYEKHQRVCIHSTMNNFKCFGLHCRSLSGSLSDPSPGFSHMPLLRVVDLPPRRNYEIILSKEIYLLVNLRYLHVEDLPNPIAVNLVNLEILHIEDFVYLMISFILKMVKLRHLRSKSLDFEKDCDTDQTTNLESLGFVNIQNNDGDEILRRSPYLRRLKCKCKKKVFPDLYSQAQLESLYLFYENPFEGELSKIYFPTTIKKLTLRGIGLPWEEVSRIGRLPDLLYLRLLFGACVGEKWETNDGEFQKLRSLRIHDSSLKQWITGSEPFPKLQCLFLDDCDELEEIPSDLGNISTLQTIEVSHCSYGACMSAVLIEKEQKEYGNEELKVDINMCQWSKEELVLKSCEQE